MRKILIALAFATALSSCVDQPCEGQHPAAAGPIEEDSWYLPTGDGAAELYVHEMGAGVGSPVVVLHGGWGAEHSYLKPVVARHGGNHRFILYDQRGSLLSPAAAKDLSVAKQVEDLELLRRTLKIEKLTLLCHSMGTYLAMEYLERHPERVEALILIGAMRAAVPKNGSDAYFERMNAYGKAFSERDSVKKELAAAGNGRSDLSPKERTHLWRIRFAAVNIFHIERWREMPGGKIFFKQAVADAIAATHAQ